MGREITNPVRRHFRYDVQSDTSTCRLEVCSKVIKGNHAANLQRHLERWHPHAFARLLRDKEELARALAQGKPRQMEDGGGGGGGGNVNTTTAATTFYTTIVATSLPTMTTRTYEFVETMPAGDGDMQQMEDESEDPLPVPQTSHVPPPKPAPSKPAPMVSAAPLPPQQLPRRLDMKPLAPKPPAPAPPPPQQQQPPPEVCLRWNSYHSNMQATFPSLLNNEQYVDVTLACEGRSIKCHKMMLSACSSYFDELLTQNPCQHPIVLMKDLKFWEIQALVDFMYCGEVNVGQDKLPSLLAAAEALQIKGLAGPASTSGPDSLADEEDSMPPLMYDSGDYLKREVPSPAQARRARKRRCPVPVPAPQPQVVPPPPPPGRSARLLQRTSTVTSGTAARHATPPAPARHSEPPPARRMRMELSPQKIVETLREIKLEPLDIDDDSIPDCGDLRPPDLCEDNDDDFGTTNGTTSEHGHSGEERPDNLDPGESDADVPPTTDRSSPSAGPASPLPGSPDGNKSPPPDDA